MERLTDTTANKCFYDTWDLCGLDYVCKRDCWKPTPCKIPAIVDKLTQYEDTNLTPSDIADHEEMFKAYRAVCGGKTPEQIAALQSDIADLRNELCLKCGRYKTAHLGSCDGCKWRASE